MLRFEKIQNNDELNTYKLAHFQSYGHFKRKLAMFCIDLTVQKSKRVITIM